MKYVLIGVVLIVGGVLVATQQDKVEYTSHHSTSTVEVHPEWATDTEAVEAAQAVIRRKELEAELNATEANFEALTAQYEADKATYEQKKEELEKELGTY